VTGAALIDRCPFRETAQACALEIWVANYYFTFAQAVATIARCVFLFVCQQLGR